jgi:cytochrome d ubiquinol oxidase subunit II
MFFMFYMYSILDGFDLGLGVMIGFITKNDDEKRTLLSTISPFWDGNEVWLVIGVSTLFAGFPGVYSKLLPAFYLPFLFIIICFISRAISLESSYSGKSLSKFSLAVFSVSSFLAASAGILFLAIIVSGLPSDESGMPLLKLEYLLQPLPLIFAAAWMLMMLMHSMSYLVRKTGGVLKDRLMRYAKKLGTIFIFLFIISLFLLYFRKPGIFMQPLAWIGVSMTISGAFLYRFLQSPKTDKYMFSLTALAMGGIWMIAAGSMLPGIINPVQDGNAAMTIYNTSAPLNTLKIVVYSSLVGMMTIIIYTIFVYRIFRLKPDSSRRMTDDYPPTR